MRISLLLTIFYIFLGLFLWVTLSGALFALSAVIYFVLLVIAIGYSDTAVLFFLGARELRSSDVQIFFEASSQEAYKLSVPQPKLYFYNGTLERAFILQNKQNLSLVISKTLIDTCSHDDLAAICFELLLQVKRGMAPKRTRVMFFLGLISWIAHTIVSLFLLLIPMKEFRQASDWFLNYLLHPWLNFLFGMVLSEKYFRKLASHLQDFPIEKEKLKRVGLRLRKADQLHSLPSRKLIELTSVTRSRSFQNILALEFLPHEWDFLFNTEEIARAKEV
jgi:hypothetical protein